MLSLFESIQGVACIVIRKSVAIALVNDGDLVMVFGSG